MFGDLLLYRFDIALFYRAHKLFEQRYPYQVQQSSEIVGEHDKGVLAGDLLFASYEVVIPAQHPFDGAEWVFGDSGSLFDDRFCFIASHPGIIVIDKLLMFPPLYLFVLCLFPEALRLK